jgi:hypothetical protein
MGGVTLDFPEGTFIGRTAPDVTAVILLPAIKAKLRLLVIVGIRYREIRLRPGYDTGDMIAQFLEHLVHRTELLVPIPDVAWCPSSKKWVHIDEYLLKPGLVFILI